MTTGNFAPVLGPQGQTVAYTWSAALDFSGRRNRWNRFVACSGAVSIQGCAEAIPVTVDVTAYDPKSGQCRIDDSTGGCASGSSGDLLSAVQDPDVVEANCATAAPSCGIGACVSSCEQACNDTYAGKDQRDARAQCKRECVCDCKAKRPAECPSDDSCH